MSDTPTQHLHLQPTINVGMIGHVSHGKTTLTKQLSAKDTMQSSEEKKRNITIQLGYANMKIYKCDQCEEPRCYGWGPSSSMEHVCEHCGNPSVLVKHISFCDCPGHEVLMATMLNGTAVMDGAILLVAADVKCPQPQTQEHLVAAEIMNLENFIVAQNKLDLVSKERALEHREEVRKFLTGTRAQDAPVVPIVAQHRYNLDALCQMICEKIPTSRQNYDGDLEMRIIRTFDVNKNGSGWKNLKGGVLGGTIVQGTMHIGDRLEIRPGIIQRDEVGNLKATPLFTRVVSLNSDVMKLDEAHPGGLVGVGTLLDPSLTKGNRLIGHVVGKPGTLPETAKSLMLKTRLLKGVVIAKTKKFNVGEELLINVSAYCVRATVVNVRGKSISIDLVDGLVCVKSGERVAISRRVKQNWRLSGYGDVLW